MAAFGLAGFDASYALADGGHGPPSANGACSLHGSIVAPQTVTVSKSGPDGTLTIGQPVTVTIGTAGQNIRVNVSGCVNGSSLTASEAEPHAYPETKKVSDDARDGGSHASSTLGTTTTTAGHDSDEHQSTTQSTTTTSTAPQTTESGRSRICANRRRIRRRGSRLRRTMRAVPAGSRHRLGEVPSAGTESARNRAGSGALDLDRVYGQLELLAAVDRRRVDVQRVEAPLADDLQPRLMSARCPHPAHAQEHVLRLLDALHRAKAKYKVLSLTADLPSPSDDPFDPWSRGYGHPRLWEHYADNHNGVCICFTKDRLLEHLERALKAEDTVFRHERVAYADERIYPAFQEKPRARTRR